LLLNENLQFNVFGKNFRRLKNAVHRVFLRICLIAFYLLQD